MTWIEVADSAIKIGLGALVGGLFTIYTLRISRENDRSKELLSNKLKMLEKSADLIDLFFNAHSKLLSRISWISKNNDGEALVIDEAVNDAIKERDASLIEHANGARLATFRLKVIGATDVHLAVKKSTQFILDFRNEFIFGREVPDMKRIETHRKEANVIKDEVLNRLGDFYASI